MQATIQDIVKVGDNLLEIQYQLDDGSLRSFQVGIEEATGETILATIQNEVDRLSSIEGKIQDLKSALITSKILSTIIKK